MTDYDLGKARGRIVIEHDDRGFTRAEKANDDLAASAHRVAEGYIDAEKAQKDYDKQLDRTSKSEQEFKKRTEAVAKALQKLNAKQEEVNKLEKEGKTHLAKYRDATQALDKAKQRYKDTVDKAAKAESYHNDQIAAAAKSTNNLKIAMNQASRSVQQATSNTKKMNNALSSVKKNSQVTVTVDTKTAMDRIRAFRKEHENLIRTMKVASSFTGGTFKVGAGVMGGASLAGAAGLAAGGLTGYGTNGIMAAAAGIGQLSGIMGLLPVVIGNLGASIGTIIIASQNMGDAFSAVASNDAQKFREALKKMSVSGQEFALAFNDIYPALEQFQRLLQDNLFRGLASEMKDLTGKYLPMMKDSFGGFADILNGTIRDLADWAKQSSVFADIQIVMNNLTETMAALAPTARIIADTFLDIMKVSSDFGPDLANSFKEVVTQFRDWIRTLRNNGDLARWIKTGIDSFSSLMRSVKVFGEAFGRIFQIQGQYSGGFFGFIERIANAFNDWTKSVEGNKALNDFFKSITDMSKALTPVLGSLANVIIGVIIPALAQLGVNLAPGLKVFFDTLAVGFRTLGEILNDPQTVTALNQFLGTLAGAFTEVIKRLGPQIPSILGSLSDAITTLVPILPTLASSIANMLPDLVRLLNLLASPAVQNAISGIDDFIKSMTLVSNALGGGWVGAIEAAKIVFEGFFNMIDERTGGFISSWANALGAVVQFGVDVEGAIIDAMGKIFSVFTQFEKPFFDWGKKIWKNFIDGMLDQLGPIGQAAKSLMDAISDWLPHSPAKKGPFSGSGYSMVRGRKLATDFAAGIVAGSGEANTAAGTLSKATEAGIHQFVQDMLDFSSLGQGILQLINDVADNIFNIAKIATTNPITGESIFGKRWQRTVSDAELQKRKEDKAYQESIKKLRPDSGQPLIPGAPGANQKNIRTPGIASITDAALLANVPAGRYVTANEYANNSGNKQIGDLTQGLGDCTSSIEDLVAMMDGKPTGGRTMATSNAEQWALANGFLPTNVPMPGTFQIGWNDSHMQATLPGGTNFNWGSDAAAQARGINGGGAWDPAFNFNKHYYRPVAGAPQAPPTNPNVPPGGPVYPPLTGPDLTNPALTPPVQDMNTQFQTMNQSLDAINQNTSDSLGQQDIMITEMRAQNPILDQAIKTAQDPSSTDSQVADALGQISAIADQQRQQDTAQSRYMAQGLDSLTSTIAGDRGMTQMQNPIETFQTFFNGAMGLAGDAIKVFEDTIQSIDAASNIADTLVRGISNTEDIYNIVDNIQKFIQLGATIAQTVSDGLAFASQIAGASGGTDGGAASGILSAASGIAGIVSSIYSTINTAIDLGQEAYRLAGKYIGRALSNMVGAGQGALMGDIKFLLDQNSMQLKTWSGDNPNDKRNLAVPSWLQFGRTVDQQGKIRDINMYIGPGTDPNEAMNAAMWSIKTDQNGVFTGSAY